MNHSRDRAPTKGAGRSGQEGADDQTLEQLWPGYLREGYFDHDGHLRVEFVTRDKVEPLVRAMARARPPLTSAQLRRFFQHCRRIETRLRSKAGSWSEVRPQVIFLDAAAQDAFGKTPKKIPALFWDFVRRNIAAIRTADDFLRGFLPHFEALVGFGAMHIKREGS